MDRERANKSIRVGLWAATLAAFLFALTFYVAILYTG
jgi:hypothetical protein